MTYEYSTPDPGRRSLIKTKDLAKRLDISVRQLQRLKSRGELIHPIQVGNQNRWRPEEVDAWIQEGCPAPRNNNQGEHNNG